MGYEVQRSYEVHRLQAERDSHSVPSIIVDPDGVDAYNHWRIYELIDPLIKAGPHASWLTVGDTGGDAYYLASRGLQHVTASSLNDVQIKALASLGHLNGVSIMQVNAERIDLPDGAFDYVLCKEAYHHFPRPTLALYELLRVARRGVLLLEPSEELGRPLDFVRWIAKRLLRGQSTAAQQFETVGNYLYRLSADEILKIACAIQLPQVAVKDRNAFYSRMLAAHGHNRNSVRGALNRLGFFTQDALCALRLMSPNFVGCYVATAPLSQREVAEFRAAGYRVIDVPKNPYL
jgi:SAM-dependent methyltransferase